MKAKKSLLTLLFLMICTFAAAQKPIIEVSNDKKKINVHELGLPESTSLKSILNMLPELLARPSKWLYENYSIEVNDVDVGDARDAVLTQLSISDIEYIEVSENPITSYQNNGQGGTISIELREFQEAENVKGSFSLNASHPLDICPHLNFGYRKDKLSVNAMAIAEFYNPKDLATDIRNSATDEYTSESTDMKFATEMAIVQMKYNPTDNNEFRLSLSENWKKEDDVTTERVHRPGIGTSTSRHENEAKLTNLFAEFEYSHYFGDASKPKDEKPRLKFETTATYRPEDNDNKQNMHSLLREHNRSNSMAGKLEYLLPLAKRVNAEKMNLTIGSNFNLSYDDEESKTDITGFAHKTDITNLNTNALTTFLSPYLQAEYVKDKISFKGICEYQYFKYDVKSVNDPDDNNRDYLTDNKSVTGKLMFGYRFAPSQTIRLIADRKIKRPTSSQIYPYMVFNINDLTFVRGNPDLRPILSHEITVDYITEVDNGDNSVVINMGFSYIQVDDVIVQSENMPLYQTRSPDEYYTFLNEGDNHIAKTNFMIFYKRRVFSILLTANMFNNIGNRDYKSSDHYTYFNTELSTSFRFRRSWCFMTSVAYNSKVIKTDETIGDNLYSDITVSKNFKNFSIGAFTEISLFDGTKDHAYTDDGMVTTTYDAVRDLVGVRFGYKF